MEGHVFIWKFYDVGMGYSAVNTFCLLTYIPGFMKKSEKMSPGAFATLDAMTNIG